jgi:hypothetical protein
VLGSWDVNNSRLTLSRRAFVYGSARTLGDQSLKFKRVHPTLPLYSVRIGRGYRALGIRDADKIVWYWIGSHAEYDREVSKW